MAQVVAPSSVNYTNQLPLGIESKSHRRLFFPSTNLTARTFAASTSTTTVCSIPHSLT